MYYYHNYIHQVHHNCNRRKFSVTDIHIEWAYFHNLSKSTSTNIQQRLSSHVWRRPLVRLGPFTQTALGERISPVVATTFGLIWHLMVGTAVRLLLMMLFQSEWVVEHIQQAKAQSSYSYSSQSRRFCKIRVVNANKIGLKEKHFTAWNLPHSYVSLKLAS